MQLLIDGVTVAVLAAQCKEDQCARLIQLWYQHFRHGSCFLCRPLGECAFSDVPNFGTIDIDWATQTLSMQVRDAADGVRILQRYDISLSTCLPLPNQG